MNTFLNVSLYFFAVCAALGTIPTFVLAAKARKPATAVIALIVAAFVIYVLIAAAVKVGQG